MTRLRSCRGDYHEGAKGSSNSSQSRVVPNSTRPPRARNDASIGSKAVDRNISPLSVANLPRRSIIDLGALANRHDGIDLRYR